MDINSEKICFVCKQYEDMVNVAATRHGFCYTYWALIVNYQACKYCEMDGYKNAA